jgi:hypothetical protein
MMLYRFDSFPGLHGDEAWTGLRALEHEERGLFTLHGMRYYAGSLYPYLLSLVFKVQGASVASLRLPGLVMNLAGLGILLTLLIRHSPRSAGLFMALSCTSLLLLLQARIAWEVMAWNLFGLACLVAAAYVFLARERASAPVACLFFAASILGALNHFVFVSLNLAFALASAVLWWSGRAGTHASRFFQLNALGMAVVLMACALQWRLGDEAFQRHSTVVVIALGALPLIATGLWVAMAPALERFTQAVDAWRATTLEGARARWPRLRIIAGAALVLFLIMHGVGLSASLSNDLLYRRLFGYVPPLAVRLAGLVFVVVLLAAVAAACVRAIRAFWLDATDVHGTFWAIFLPVYAACFPLFTSRESARHYLLLTVALFYAGAVLVPRYLPQLRTRLLAVTLAFATTTQVMAWWNLSSPPRPPLDFRVGWRRETSKHMLSIAPVYEQLKSEGICRYEGEFFVREPLEFLRRSERWDCANPVSATIEYCSTCEATFFYSVQR